MERNWDLNEVSDGRLYEEKDMAKLGCNDCKGCSKCCHDMGTSITLDPYDVHRMTVNLHRTFEEMLKKEIEFNVVDGIILPNLKMMDEGKKCYFLDSYGRCSIHMYRPGICRLFPLGRVYENGDFRYFNQVYECPIKNKTKVKIEKWLDTENVKMYHKYICTWHYFLKDIQNIIKNIQDENQIKTITMYLLNLFYMTPYNEKEDFYGQFQTRINKVKEVIG